MVSVFGYLYFLRFILVELSSINTEMHEIRYHHEDESYLKNRAVFVPKSKKDLLEQIDRCLNDANRPDTIRFNLEYMKD